jgi:hypothetical protein
MVNLPEKCEELQRKKSWRCQTEKQRTKQYTGQEMGEHMDRQASKERNKITKETKTLREAGRKTRQGGTQ